MAKPLTTIKVEKNNTKVKVSRSKIVRKLSVVRLTSVKVSG